MNYYSHHIGDFNNATIHLTEVEECMYHRALAWYYSNEKPLPKDKAQVYRYLRARTTATKHAVDAVLADFFTEQDDGWHQSRCDEEIAAYKEKAEIASKAGKASAAKRAEKSPTEDKPAVNANSTDVQRTFNVTSTDVQPTNNQEPITNIKNTHTNASEDFAPDLEQLNAKLKMAGGQVVTQKQLDQVLVTFNPHYETQVLTDNQLMAKLVQWIKGDQDKSKRTSSKPVTTKATTGGDVNSKWQDQVGKPQPVTAEALAEMEAFKARIAAEGC